MTELEQALALLRAEPGCALLPAAGLPRLKAGVSLPPDLGAFYRTAGGATLFGGAEYPYFVVNPDQFLQANALIVGEPCPDDISTWWYTLVHDGSGYYLTIDLNPERLGRCYDSFHETHGLVGQTPVIALSFSDLLQRLLKNHGAYPYWLEPSFSSLGDAYDGLGLGSA